MPPETRPQRSTLPRTAKAGFRRSSFSCVASSRSKMAGPAAQPSCDFGIEYIRIRHWTDSRMSPQVIAVYPGSFDPGTNGHLDLIARGAMIYDRLIVAVTHNIEKDPLFSLHERIEMLEAVTM